MSVREFKRTLRWGCCDVNEPIWFAGRIDNIESWISDSEMLPRKRAGTMVMEYGGSMMPDREREEIDCGVDRSSARIGYGFCGRSSELVLLP